jgi:hypothetical protein
MLFKILKLFGLDLGARIEAAKASLELRLERATDHIKDVARGAVLIAILGFAALITSMMAATAGLVAVYRLTADVYGDYAGLGAVAGILIAVTIVLIALIIARARELDAPTMPTISAGGSAPTPQLRGSAAADEPPAARRPNFAHMEPMSSPASADDLVAPLAFVLSDVVKFPRVGNPAVDELIDKIRVTAHGSADEAVSRAANVIRYGNRLDLILVLSGTAAIAWLVTANTRARP